MIDSNLTGKLALDANSLSDLKSASKDNSPASVKAVASQFEAMFVNMMLKSMRDATPQEGMFDNEQTKTFTAMLDQQLSQNIASHGVGLADILTRQLTRASNFNVDELPLSERRDMVPQRNTDLEIGGANLRSFKTLPPETNKPVDRTSTNATPVSQPTGSVHSFKNRVASHAEQVSRETGIPAHFMIGQAALESGWGKHEIKGLDGTTSHNLFGIKATASWKGKVVEAMTTEYVNGVKQKRIEKFRAYDSYAETFQDFAKLMKNNPRYDRVMANLDNVNNYAAAIQKSGYATDPNYASKLISVVKKVAV
jgi:peptidoglycan hydrolase FlgJ